MNRINWTSKTGVVATFLVIAAGTAGAGATIGTPLPGDFSLKVMADRVISECGLTGSIPFFGTSYDNGLIFEDLFNVHQIAPMNRAFNSSNCPNSQGKKMAGLEIAREQVQLVAASAASAQCQGQTPSGGLARNTTISVQNPPGADTSYTFSDWRDVLRTLYAGRDQAHQAGDCNSNVRRALQKTWSKLFQAGCGATPCSSLRHVWRPGDSQSATDALVALTGLPNLFGSTTRTPFCNGLEFEDRDPIRVPCDASDDVCGGDGTLGLLQAIVVPQLLPTAAAFPQRSCDAGVYDWAPAPLVTLDTCPGGGVNVFTLCLMPAYNDLSQSKGLNHSCLKRESNDAPFFTPNTVNTLAYNQHVRNPNGSLTKDEMGREISSAIYRLRSRNTAGCRLGNSIQQLGCLASQYNCTLGFTNAEAVQAGAVALAIGGVEPSPATVLNRTYPLARSLYLNTVNGFSNLVDINGGRQTFDRRLASCFANSNGAALFAGFVPMNAVDANARVKCVDFDETVCGALTNVDACLQ